MATVQLAPGAEPISFKRSDSNREVYILRLNGADYKVFTPQTDSPKVSSLVELMNRLNLIERMQIPKKLKFICGYAGFDELKNGVCEIGSNSTDEATKIFFTQCIKEEERKEAERKEEERRTKEAYWKNLEQEARISKYRFDIFVFQGNVFTCLNDGDYMTTFINALDDKEHPCHPFSVSLLKKVFAHPIESKQLAPFEFKRLHEKKYGPWAKRVMDWHIQGYFSRYKDQFSQQ